MMAQIHRQWQRVLLHHEIGVVNLVVARWWLPDHRLYRLVTRSAELFEADNLLEKPPTEI